MGHWTPGEFEAEFVINGVESSAVYDANGDLIETETEIKENELPQPVKTSLAQDYKGYKLDEIAKIIDAKGVVTYELETDKAKSVFESAYDNNGKLLKKQEKKEDKGEKD
jgi:hypothetical protein